MASDSDRRPTLKSLAEITGLGISTVSQALRDSDQIAEETRKRVKLAAMQAGYRPNRAGVRLRTGKTNVITVVLNPGDDGSGFFSNFVYGIADAVAETTYHLVVTPYSLADPMEPVRYIVETGSADGVIMSRTLPDDPRVKYLMDNAIPFATHGRTEMGIAHPFHDFDNEAFAMLAVEKLATQGRSRVALLGPPPGLSYHNHTIRGFERGIQKHQLESVSFASVNVDTSLQGVRIAARNIASQASPPDGVICSASRMAIAVLAGFQDAGKAIGRDFDLVTKHSTDLLEMMEPRIITIPEDFRQAGQDCANMVMAWIKGEDPATLQRLVSPLQEN